MIIKITPETDAEKMKIQEVEHHGVKEFFIFGSKKDADEDAIDFHDWSGSYRYLVGSLYYFTKQLADEQESKAANPPMEINLNAPNTPEGQAPQIIQMEQPQMTEDAQNKATMIKTSNAEDGSIEGVVEVKEPPSNASNVTDFPATATTPVEAEMAVEENTPNDTSKGAEEPF